MNTGAWVGCLVILTALLIGAVIGVLAGQVLL